MKDQTKVLYVKYPSDIPHITDWLLKVVKSNGLQDYLKSALGASNKENSFSFFKELCKQIETQNYVNDSGDTLGYVIGENSSRYGNRAYEFLFSPVLRKAKNLYKPIKFKKKITESKKEEQRKLKQFITNTKRKIKFKRYRKAIIIRRKKPIIIYRNAKGQFTKKIIRKRKNI